MVRNLPHLVYFENSNARVGVYMWRRRVPRLKIAASHTHKCISLYRSSITHLAEDRGTNLAFNRKLKCNLLGEKDGLYMLVLLASPRWR